MSSLKYRKPLYQTNTDLATSSQPLQYDTQMTYVESQNPQPQTSQPINVNSNEETSQPWMPSTENEADMDLLWDEHEQLKTRAIQLEARETSAENGYKDLWELRDLEPRKSLEKYKDLAEKRFKASEVEIKTLQDLTRHQERHITQSSVRIEKARFETHELRTNPQLQAEHQKLRNQLATHRGRLENEDKKIQELQRKIEELEKIANEVQQQILPTSQEQQIIIDLQRKMNLYETMWHLSILDRRRMESGDVYTCQQTGRNGLVCYELAFFLNHDGQRTIRYKPLLDRSDDILPVFMKDELEFAEIDAVIFFWRIMTIVNKKLDDSA